MMTWWMWVLAGLMAATAEAVVGTELYLLFFGGAAVLTGLATAAGFADPLWLQLTLFILFSFIGIVAVRRKLAAKLHAAIPDKEIDSLVGQRATAMGEIPGGGEGKAELRGTAWSARNATDTTIAADARCLVERVDGLTLWVRPE